MIEIDWSSPQDRIPELRARIQANDYDEAAQILAPFLASQLRIATPHNPLEVSPVGMENALRWRLSLCVDPLAYVLTLHLFTEFWMNRALDKWMKESGPDLTYFEKVQLFPMLATSATTWLTTCNSIGQASN